MLKPLNITKGEVVESIVARTLRNHGPQTATNVVLTSSKTKFYGRNAGKFCRFDILGYDPEINLLLNIECKYRKGISRRFGEYSNRSKAIYFSKHYSPPKTALWSPTNITEDIYQDGKKVTGKYLGQVWRQKNYLYWKYKQFELSKGRNKIQS